MATKEKPQIKQILDFLEKRDKDLKPGVQASITLQSFRDKRGDPLVMFLTDDNGKLLSRQERRIWAESRMGFTLSAGDKLVKVLGKIKDSFLNLFSGRSAGLREKAFKESQARFSGARPTPTLPPVDITDPRSAVERSIAFQRAPGGITPKEESAEDTIIKAVTK